MDTKLRFKKGEDGGVETVLQTSRQQLGQTWVTVMQKYHRRVGFKIGLLNGCCPCRTIPQPTPESWPLQRVPSLNRGAMIHTVGKVYLLIFSILRCSNDLLMNCDWVCSLCSADQIWYSRNPFVQAPYLSLDDCLDKLLLCLVLMSMPLSGLLLQNQTRNFQLCEAKDFRHATVGLISRPAWKAAHPTPSLTWAAITRNTAHGSTMANNSILVL